MNLSTLKIAAASVMAFAAAAANASLTSVNVINRSGDAIVSINVSPTYSIYEGGQDLLGSNMLFPGYQQSIEFGVRDARGECMLDVVAYGTRNVWRKRMDVCRITNWTLY